MAKCLPMKQFSLPSKAVILAAGFGTRLLPLSLDTPKPMIPVWGKPALGHVLDLLQRWGVQETLINLHFQPGAIFQYAKARSRPGFRIVFSFEPEILGTGGALRKASWFLPEHAPFWLINADIAADLQPSAFIAAMHSPKTMAALWMHDSLGPRTVEMRRGFVTNFQSARPETKDTYTFCGLHLLRPCILSHIPLSGFSSIITAYNNAMATGRRIAGICEPECYWEDLGTPESYRKAHGEIQKRFNQQAPGAILYDPAQEQRIKALRKKGVKIEGFAALGQNVVVAPGARVADSVIWDGAHIAKDASVIQAVVGTNTTVCGAVQRLAIRSEYIARNGNINSDPLLGRVLQHMRWQPDQTTAEPFAPRGSARSFIRLQHAGRSVVMIRYSLDRAENGFYAAHARFLKKTGLRVPEVLLDWPAERLLLLEDLGNNSLQDAVANAAPEHMLCIYKPILDAVLRLHTTGSEKAARCNLELTPPFSSDLYRWEREFFGRHFLRRHMDMPETAIRPALRNMTRVAERLIKLPKVLIHRDLQSSNILLLQGKPAFIDFQGMRKGPAAYDLASLLCDPYVAMPTLIREQLLCHYADQAAWQPRQREAFWWAAVERLAQALGAYARLGAMPDTAWFANYIPPALERMLEALSRISPMPALQAVILAALDKSKSQKMHEPCQ